ncbi:alpha/beta hydrolase family protein [Variovorax rhizosphaerae]|uniref:Prolyl oligopeptidase family serine peptidase n=1 Tax=Variovorax rhizosphaerae TaxID=1836200 RepID=A0ABU8WFR2_9BURK
MIRRALFVALVFCAGMASGQTRWPDYISSLEPDTSESPVMAALPADAVVRVPDAALPASRKRWSGAWSGWACAARVCDVKVAVEQVSDQGATIVYAAASSAMASYSERLEARFNADGELQGTLTNGRQLVFRLRDGNVMEFLSRRSATEFAAGVLAKADASSPQRVVERIPTPFVEGGKPVSLEVVIYKPAGIGPFPLLMVNHGSTGNGDNPALFTSTFTSPTLTRYFVGKGWMVAYPQRRGRGKSDGLYDEGFNRERSAYSCNPALSLAGFDHALADVDAAADYLLAKPEVDTRHSVIAGVSRGGVLSVAYAGMHPERFAGVINFVGGWMGDGCLQVDAINAPAFERGARFRKPELWLYGENDPFYKMAHSRKNYDAFTAAGGRADFVAIDPGIGQGGHGIHARPELWRDAVNQYLGAIARP